jgi:hypothetical protein
VKLTAASVRARVKHWQRRLHLEDWDLRVTFGPNPEDQSEASCRARHEYGAATLNFDLSVIPAGELDDYIRHEIVHLPSWAAWHAAEQLAKTDFEREILRVEFEKLTTYLERLAKRVTAR